MSLVDVIVPAYNPPIDYLRNALESVRAQTIADWRVFVADDGSSDASAAAMRDLIGALGDARIVSLTLPHGGVAAARNAAIAAGSAPFIAMLDSDDAWYPRRLERSLAAFGDDPVVALVHADADLMNAEGRVIGHTAPPPCSGQSSAAEQMAEMLLKNYVNIATVTLRRDAGRAVGYFDASYAVLEDKVMWLALLGHGYRFVHVPEVLARYRSHASGLSGKADLWLHHRMRLIAVAESMVRSAPGATAVRWPRLRAELSRRALRQAVYGYRAQRRFARAALAALRLVFT